MASKRQKGMGLGSNTAFPTRDTMSQPGDYPRNRLSGASGYSSRGTPVQPSGEVRTQKGGGRSRSDGGADVYERGRQPTSGRERNPPGGRQDGMSMDDVYSAMAPAAGQGRTIVGPLARPGSERNSATMDARSSVPASIQEGSNTRDRFASMSYGDNDQRFDNAELDDGTGTGRRSRGTFRGSRRM